MSRGSDDSNGAVILLALVFAIALGLIVMAVLHA